MFEEQIKFRDFTRFDYSVYAGVLKLPNGENPKIYQHITEDGLEVDFIISGNDSKDSLITMISEDSEYIVCIPGFNMCHYAIVIGMVTYFKDYEIGSEAVDAIASDFNMVKVMEG